MKLSSNSLFSFLFLLSFLSLISGSCLNHCNYRGTCNSKALCECNPGFYGPTCELKYCPLGTSWVDIPSSEEQAHSLSQCSSKGQCDHSTGLCQCFPGFTGDSCDKLACLNDCSGHGKCLSLRQAAALNDGFKFNYSTTYNLWDADKIYGCQCDYGYLGSDCSQRDCEYGPDPRIEGPKRETVNLACECDVGSPCNYKFKISMYGSEVDGYFSQDMTILQFRNKISNYIGLVSNDPVNDYQSIIINSGLDTDTICSVGTLKETSLSFRRNIGDLPQLYISTSRIKNGKVYFNTYQDLVCDCRYDQCVGSFRFSFDGQVSSNFATKSTPYEILRELSNMPLVTQQSFSVSIDTTKSTSPLPYYVCTNGELNRIVYKISGNIGNTPTMIAMSSVVDYRDNYPYYISNEDTISTLYIESENGISSESKLCNGIGKCHFDTGKCECPLDWGPDPDLGPCGGLALNTSTWEGFARCPGVVSPSSFSMENKKTMNQVPNNIPLTFITLNPVTNPSDSSSIYAIPWQSETIRGSVFDTDNANLLVSLTSNNAAGPIIYDQTKDRIFFANNDPLNFFIGYISVESPLDSIVRSLTNYVITEGEVFSLVFDAHFHRRNIYWSIPSQSKIYRVNVDLNVVDPLLVDVYSSSFIINPTGLSIFITRNKIYWTDITSDVPLANGVINEANLDFTDQKEFYKFSSTDAIPVSNNLKGNVIHLNMNNTMFILDGGDSSLIPPIPPQIIAVNLDNPIIYDTDPDVEEHNEQYYSPRVLVEENTFAGINTPHSIAIDSQNFVMIWTEPTLNLISFLRYKMTYVDITSPGKSFTGINDLVNYDPDVDFSIPQIEFSPVGIAFSKSLSIPNFGNYLDCYGSGVCLTDQSVMCECYPGYEGDCQKRTCPSGLAWFHEPRGNNIAHDVYSECSGVGVCDYFHGTCTCNPGFEGTACERMSCQTPSILKAKLKRDSKTSITNTNTKSTSNYFQFHQNVEVFPPCGLSGGRCLSMQTLGKYNLNTHKDSDPVNYSKYDLLNTPMTWDSEKIYGCKAETYGFYYGDFYINDAKDFYFGTNYQCPSGINRRFLEDEEANLNGFVGNEVDIGVEELSDGVVTNRPTLSPSYTPTFSPDFKFTRLTPKTEKGTFTSSINRREIQTIACSAKGGHFRIKFRGKITDVIPADVTPYQLKLYLESLPTIGKVNVRFYSTGDNPNVDAGVLCHESTRNYGEIEFLSLFEPAPLLQIQDQQLYGSLGTIDIFSIQKATDEGLFECSARGICDENKGECECMGNFSFSLQNQNYKWTYFSSDGGGKLGTRDDCGIYLNK